MGYLIHFVLAFVALAATEGGLPAAGEQPLGVLLLALVPRVLLFATRRSYLRGQFRAAGLFERLQVWSPPALYLLALTAFGWLDTVVRWTGVEAEHLIWPHPVELLALAPFALYGLASIDARARLSDTRDAEIARTRRFHQRMFATGAVPVIVLVFAAWALSSNEVLRVHLEEVALLGAGVGALAVLAFMLVLPAALMRLWDTQPLPPGPRSSALEELAQRAGFRCRGIHGWITGHLMANAAVIGLSPRTRYVLFTDALLSQLSLRELRAVFAHEMGHVHYRHALTFLAWSLAFYLTIDLLSVYVPLESELVGLGLLAVVFLLWLAGFGWMSRRAEQEADLFSLELTGDLGGLVSALERVGGTHSRQISTWRHFSTATRIEHLVRALAEPEFSTRHHRLLRRVRNLGVALMLVALVFEGVQLAADYPLGRLRADVRLGQYSSASARLTELDSADLEDLPLERVLERALSLGDGADAAALRGRARAALAVADLEAAVDYASLAYWRGARELEPLIIVLEAHFAGEEQNPSAMDRVPEDWAEDLARALRTGSR